MVQGSGKSKTEWASEGKRKGRPSMRAGAGTPSTKSAYDRMRRVGAVTRQAGWHHRKMVFLSQQNQAWGRIFSLSRNKEKGAKTMSEQKIPYKIAEIKRS